MRDGGDKLVLCYRCHYAYMPTCSCISCTALWSPVTLRLRPSTSACTTNSRVSSSTACHCCASYTTPERLTAQRASHVNLVGSPVPALASLSRTPQFLQVAVPTCARHTATEQQAVASTDSSLRMPALTKTLQFRCCWATLCTRRVTVSSKHTRQQESSSRALCSLWLP